MALDFVAGCLGGCAGVLVGYPFDTVKVRLQTQHSRHPKYKGTFNCFTTIIRNEKVFGLYKGMTSPLAGVAVVNAIVFGVYGNVQRRLSMPDSMTSVFVAGTAAGFVQSLVCSPMELIKLRMQIQEDTIRSLRERGVAAHKLPVRYRNPLDCIAAIKRVEGFRGLMRGLPVTAVREGPSFGVYFAAYEFFVSFLSDLLQQSTPGAFPILMAGGLSGICSWMCTYPVDVVKTRLQADGEGGQPRVYRNAWDCVVKSYKSEGYRVFARGLTSTIIRAFPTNAATFAVVSWTFTFCGHTTIVHEGTSEMKPIAEYNVA